MKREDLLLKEKEMIRELNEEANTCLGANLVISTAQLNKVLTELNKPYDKPDSEGWWWLADLKTDGSLVLRSIIHINQPEELRNLENIKCSKAIVPEYKE